MTTLHKSTQGATSVLVSVALLVVGLAIGFGAAKAANNNDTTKPNSSTVATSATKAADLRANLVALAVTHQDLTDAAVSAALDGAPNAKEVGADLYGNGDQIGAAIGSVYGKDAQTTFNTVWKIHLDNFVKYAVASKGGDTAGQAAALKTIDTDYTRPLAAFLAKANPNLPEATLYSALSEHITMTAEMIDNHVKGDYAAEASMRDQGARHLNGVFSTLAGGIVKQYPDKF